MNIAALSGSQKLAGSSLAFLYVCAATCTQKDPRNLSARETLWTKRTRTPKLSHSILRPRRRVRTTPKSCDASRNSALNSCSTRRTAAKKLLGEKAIDAAKGAVKADPANSQAHLALAIAYGRVALDESARRKVEMSRLVQQEAEAAARLDPGNDLAWHVLGRWNYELANFNPVLKALAQTIYGRLPDASNERAVECFQKGRRLFNRSAWRTIWNLAAPIWLSAKHKGHGNNSTKEFPLPSHREKRRRRQAAALLPRLIGCDEPTKVHFLQPEPAKISQDFSANFDDH